MTRPPRFLKEGIWENGYDDKLLDMVRAMQPGERIAIKAAYTRKHGLPFDNRGRTVSVMGIKAVGTITENPNDGKRVKVDWAQAEPVREWYFYTHRGTIWRMQPGDWMNDALIAFAFEGKPQDLERFRNEPFWRERFGRVAPEKPAIPVDRLLRSHRRKTSRSCPRQICTHRRHTSNCYTGTGLELFAGQVS